MGRTSFSEVTSAEQIEEIRQQSDSLCIMQPGQQSELMYRYEFETLVAGEKGSGKSRASIIWLIRGNLDVPAEDRDQVDLFYFHSPLFRAAVVRKNVDDLNSWVEDAKRVYGTKGDLLGATYTQQPREFTWPSGAKIALLHMGDRDSYMRLTGWSLTRLFWDEITFEPDVDVYEKVFSSIRSSSKKLRAQILLACNPEGPGLAWVKERFVRYKGKDGRIYKPGEVMNIPVYDPISKSMKYTTRIFLHWRLDQNKALLESDPLYAARLASISNPSLREAYLHGNFDAAGGKFFEFRRSRREYEPTNACHIYDAKTTVIQPWWPRLIGLDWGFSHYFAAYKITLSPDGRVWVIDEMVEKGLGSKELGAALARWCAKDMAGLKHHQAAPVIPVFLSPDAIEQRRDAYGTTAEMISEGIMEVYGRGSSEILASEETAVSDFETRRLIQREAKMPLRRATNRRAFGWNHMRDLMRWEQIAEPDDSQFSYEEWMRLAMIGAKEGFDYQRQFEKKPKALPRLQISSLIRHLPDALEGAISAENDLEDVSTAARGNRDVAQLQDDVLDAIRYGLVATRLYNEVSIPLATKVQSVLDGFPNMTADERFQATAPLHRHLSTKKVKGFRIGRGANAGVHIVQ